MGVDVRKVVKVENFNLKILLLTCQDKLILEGLEKGFPEYFTTKPFQPIAISRLWHALEVGEAEALWPDVLCNLDVPHLTWGDITGSISTTIPFEWCDKVRQIQEEFVDTVESYDLIKAPNERHILSLNGAQFLLIEVFGYHEPSHSVEGLVAVPDGVIDFSS